MKPIIQAILSAILISITASNISSTKVMAANVDSKGNFVTVEAATAGEAKIVKDGDRNYIELSKDFKTSKDGPDLKVILYREIQVPLHLKGLTYLNLGALKSFEGVQRYEIPNNVNLREIQSVGIWCERFDVTFGSAPLR